MKRENNIQQRMNMEERTKEEEQHNLPLKDHNFD